MLEPAQKAHPLVAAFAFFVALASGIYGSWFWITRDRGPDAAELPRAAKVIREAYQAGDLIFIVPFYAARAKESLGDLNPLALRDPLYEDFAVHPRAWVFGMFGEGDRLRPRMEAAGMKHISRNSDAAGITVDLYETHADRTVVYSFLENLKSARVHHEKDGKDTPCASWTEKNGQGGSFGRWACPYDADWFYVAPEWHRQGDHLRFCLWAHPPNQGRLVITYPNVPMTGELFGRAGHTLNSSVYARARVDLDVQVGELAPQRFGFELTDYFRPFVLDVPSTGTATVSFAVSSPDAGANHFCFVAEMRAPAAANNSN